MPEPGSAPRDAGADTEAVLMACGFSAEEIAALT
jgi:crotonobetainyl-CoA:carnitine CoA-transferase CaiB-like acyl-CoA transferase